MEEKKEAGFDKMVNHFKRMPFQHHSENKYGMSQDQDDFP